MFDLDRIVHALRGRMHGRRGICFCPAHENTRTPALSIAIGENGRLLLHCFAGCSFGEVLDALRRQGHVKGAGGLPPLSQKEVISITAAKRAEAEKKVKQARKIWYEAQSITGTIAERYLRGRHITCDLLPSLRFHPDCWHGPTARRHPAMVALIEGGEGFAIHRTFLQPDGNGKADVPAGTEKMMLGPARGGHVEIARANGPLMACEGIETGLALASGLLSRPATVWAGCGTAGLSSLCLPESSGRLIIAADGDQAGEKASKALALRAREAGWVVSLLPAPDGKDWADVLAAKMEQLV